jgi:hypothetical protein
VVNITIYRERADNLVVDNDISISWIVVLQIPKPLHYYLASNLPVLAELAVYGLFVLTWYWRRL